MLDNAPSPMPHSSAAVTSPEIAVVVPIYRHSVLLSEAIDSVLEQRGAAQIAIVLVNDGCPHHETDRVCRDYAMAYPDRIIYLRKPNGGLSDARNHGIRHAMNAWPSVEAIYMLDADNRLRPDALNNALQALHDDPAADWIYPNIDMFGLQWAGDYGGDYSLLVHTAMNICEAGSLIRRKVFEAGVFFDITFMSGFEDWDFFLTAAEAGFRGKNLENFGFLYRKRAESMLADSERDAEAIRSAMRKKHKAIFSPRGLAQLEQVEAPRYALYLSDCDEVLLTTDPDLSEQRRISVAEFETMWWRTQTDNTHHHCPPILVVTHSAVLAQLTSAKLLHGLLWTMERQLAQKPFVAVELQPQEAERLSWIEEDVHGGRELNAAILMVRPGVMTEIVRDSSINWAAGVAARPCAVPTLSIGYQLNYQFFPDGQTPYQAAAHDFVALCSQFRASPMRGSLDMNWDWRRPDIPWRSRTHEITRIPTLANAAYPRVSAKAKDVGFVLPLVEFGGVERVALNTARAMKRAGWRPHLFIIDSDGCQFSAEWHDAFESVTFLADRNFATWGGASSSYIGTDVSDWSRHGDQRDATAMLAWLDVVINFHGGAISGLMGRLRKFGVKTGLSLHLNDHSPFKRLVGNTYLGLAFEHAYDLFMPCSQQLADWCHAMGVPEEKIVPVLNAPGFELSDTSKDAINARHGSVGAYEGLKVIYLGRLDQQKGLERLIGIVNLSQTEIPSVQWRLIGKQVVAGNGARLPSRIHRMIEPALTNPEDLAKALEWADVFILPSYFEGLPLTILEAMRSGVVPVATDAGAVSEVVNHWQNGVVLSQDDTVIEAVKALRRMASDRKLLYRLSTQARQDMQGRDWDSAVAPVMARLAAMMEAGPEQP
ncbi:glycosyltransferase [Paracoccus sp. R86501]|uniref:glycosyltransferase n=1 Tax=Paracoccus sp. R86501 TaxID=3101711 RepID=UPI00366DBACC